jgi:uncharacterized transporter YbjL
LLNLLGFAFPLIAGTLLGYFLRDKKRINLGRITFGTILALIFSLGFSIGSNNELLGVMPKVGLNAVVILTLTILFSVVFLKAAGKMVRME